MQELQRKRRPAITRNDIVSAAIRTIEEEGPARFTLDAVVSRLSVSKGALLHHFPSKAALLLGVVDRVGQEFVEAVEAEAASDPCQKGRHARAYLKATANYEVTDQSIGVGKIVLAACLLEPSLAERWQWWTAKLMQDEPTDPAGADDALLQRLVADGLWLSDILGTHAIDASQRQALLALLGCGTPAGSPS